MREQDVFVLADRALDDVVRQITDEQWAMPMPADFAMRWTDDRVPTLREVINYHAYDDAWVPDMLAGRTMDEVGRAKFDGDLLGADPKAAFSRLVDAACAAAAGLDDPGRTVHCSFGDFTAREYLWQVNSFRGLRARSVVGDRGRAATVRRTRPRNVGGDQPACRGVARARCLSGCRARAADRPAAGPAARPDRKAAERGVSRSCRRARLRRAGQPC